LYQSYYTGANGFLPDHYVGDLQGFDLFVDRKTQTYMVKYNQYYVIIPEHLFDLAFTEMDAGELNVFLCKALFDNIDVTVYLTNFLKGKKQYDYLNHNGTYRPLTDEEREERQRKHDEAMRLKQEEDRKLQEQIEYMREHEACTRLTTSLRTDNIGKIVNKFISQLQLMLDAKNVVLKLTDEANAKFAHDGFDDKMGARPMGRLIDQVIKRPIAPELLFGKLKNGGTVEVGVVDGKFHLDYTATPEEKEPLLLTQVVENQ
jgi:hypothetical protein